MTTRTPAAIFDEVLDAWDDERRHRLMNEHDLGRVSGTELDRHLARVRAYREEFRAAMQRDELCCSTCGRPFVLHGINCPTLSEPVALSAPERALADANPSTYPEILPPGQPVKPPRVGPGDHLLREPPPRGGNQR